MFYHILLITNTLRSLCYLDDDRRAIETYW